MNKIITPNISKIITSYFVIGAIEGSLSLWLLVRLPTDRKTAFLFGYSPLRLVMLTTICVGIVLFLGLAVKSKKTGWQRKFISLIDKIFQSDTRALFTIGFLLSAVILGAIFLYSSFIQSDYLLRPHLIRPIELIRTIMDRLAPVVFWTTLLSFQTLVLLTRLGYGTKDFYYRVLRAISIVIFPLVLAIFLLINLIDSRYYRYINNEDQFVEWLTFVFLVLTGLLSIKMTHQAYKTGNHYIWFYLFFGIACVLLGFEEISWGQRVIGLESPPFFMENSDQQEINIHNVVNLWFSVRTKHVAAVVLLIFGVCLPILALNNKIKLFLKKMGIVVPPLFLVGGFTIGAILTLDIFSGQEEEVAEFILSLCLLFFIILEYLKPEGNQLQSTPSEEAIPTR